MTQLLSLSRSARLAGVTRAEIQRRIRRGELTTFEGEIAVSDLLRVFHDYPLSAREQEMGYMLACSNTAVTDHPDPASRLFYLAGPAGSIEPLATALRERGVTEQRLSLEALDE